MPTTSTGAWPFPSIWKGSTPKTQSFPAYPPSYLAVRKATETFVSIDSVCPRRPRLRTLVDHSRHPGATRAGWPMRVHHLGPAACDRKREPVDTRWHDYGRWGG